MTDEEIKTRWPNAVIRRPLRGPVFLERVQGDGRPVSLHELLGEPSPSYSIPKQHPIKPEDIKAMREAFWSGEATQRELCIVWGKSPRTMFLLLHNLTYWWI